MEQIPIERCDELITEIIIKKNIDLFKTLRDVRTLKKVKLELVEVHFIPKKQDMEEGKFYYSEEFQTANHLCACGCGEQIPIPIREGEWQILNKNKLTVTPSLQQRFYCKAHYIITDGFANIVNEPIPKEVWHPTKDTHAPGSCPL